MAFRAPLPWSVGLWLAAAFAASPRSDVVAGRTEASAVREARQATSRASPASSCTVTTSERVIAVADVHGAADRFIRILKEAGLLDAREHWSGGRAILLQLGDVLDRGPDSRKALDLLRRLEGEAAKAGGRVIALLGNHEVMRMMHDLRYVSPGEYAAFRTADSEALRERYYRALTDREAAQATTDGQRFDERGFRRKFLSQIPLGFVDMQIAFEPEGVYGRWLRGHDAMAKVNGVVFLHGGTSSKVAALGCETINTTVHNELQTVTPPDDSTRQAMLITAEDGPLWYRGLAKVDTDVTASDVDAMLRALGANTIVVGHTVAEGVQVQARFGNRVVQLDTGMLGGEMFPGGHASALEIQNGTFTVITEGRRQVLFTKDPAPAARLRGETGGRLALLNH